MAFNLADLAAHDELLLRASRLGTDAANTDRIEWLRNQGIDWDRLLSKAERHGVTPLLHRTLATNFAESLPQAACARLSDRFRQNAHRNLCLTRQLLTILKLCESNGLLLVPFKGITLAVLAYGDLSLRQCGDLDLLLPRSDYRKARDLLVSLQYRPRLNLSPRQEENYLDETGEFVFDKDAPETSIDLHTELLPRYFAFTLNPLCRPHEMQRLSLGGATISTMASEDLLLYLCVHGAKHWWEFLGWICDVAELIRARADLNWERVLRTSRQFRSERMLNLGLVLAHDLLGAPVPASIYSPAKDDPLVELLALQVTRGFCRPDHRCLNGWEGFVFHTRVRDRFWDKVRYPLLSAAIQPRLADREFLQLPRQLSFLYYFIRPLRLAAKYGKSLLAGVRSSVASCRNWNR
jgi:hypothetical protein